MKRAGFLFSLILVTAVYGDLAKAQSMFQKVIGGTAGDELTNYTQMTSDSGQIMVGSTDGFGSGGNDIYLVKTDASGAIQWNKTYGGFGTDVGYDVQPTSDNGYIVIGETNSSGAGGQDIFVIKTDAVGDTMWTKTYGGTGVDVGYSVRETFDGGYILAGYTGSFGTGAEDIYVIKTDGNGDTLWTKTYGSGGFDYAYSIIQTADSGYIFTGETYQVGGGDAFLIKTDSMGDTTWTRTYGGNSGFEGGWVVRETMDGGYAFAGWTSSFGAGDFDFYLVKTDAFGDTLWTRSYGGTLGDVGLSLVETADTSYLISGYTFSFGTINGDAYGLAVSSTGTVLWSMAYGGVSGDAAYSMETKADGGYVLGAYSFSLSGGDADYYLIHTDSAGSSGSCYETSVATIMTSSATNVGPLNVTTVMNAAVGMVGTSVTSPAAISRAEYSVSITDSTDNACSGDSSGTATAAITGGTLAYTYSWNDALVQSGTFADSLPPGTYQVLVIDGLGCMDSAIVTIVEPPVIVVMISDSNHVTCNGAGDGSATVSASGGVGPLVYLWDDPGAQTDSVMSGVDGGTYTCMVTDSTGCTLSISFIVNEPIAISLAVSSNITLLCNADSSATMTATASGGIGTLSYLWDDLSTQTTPTATAVPNGSYTVVVTDSTGCSVMDTVTFGLLASISSSATPVCGGICDGSATLLGTGGSGAMSYVWDDPSTQNSATAANLCGGNTFTGTVTDAVGCTASASVTFPSITPMTVNLNTTAINCFGNCTGAVTVFVTGGVSPYTYWWPSLGSASPFVNSLCVGVYDIIVTDGIGCSFINTVSITQPADTLAASMSITPTSCFGGSDGAANVSVTGGTPPYTYNWIGTASNSDTSDVPAGTYVVGITDAKNCTRNDTAFVTEPLGLLATGSSSADSGNGTGQAWVTASGGTAPYSYLWDDDLTQNTDTASALDQGNYSVVVSDDNGCSLSLALAVGDLSVAVFESTYEGTLDDLARGLDLLTGGGHVVAGITESFGSGGSDMFLVNTDDNGNLRWAKTYGGSGDDGANSVLQTSDGGFIMVGYTESFGSGSFDLYVVKTDAAGVIEWTQAYGGSSDERAYAVAEVTGGYVIAGGTSSFGAGGTDVYLLKIDDTGVEQWNKTFGGPGFEYAYDVKETADGGFIVAGYTYSFGAGGSDAYLIKTDVTGASTWTKVIGGTSDEAAWSVVETSSGYAFTGNTESFGSGLQDVYFVQTDVSGNPTLTKTYGEESIDYGNDLIATSDGGYVIVGYTKSFSNNGDDVYIIKTDGNGDITWSRTYGGSFNDRAWAVQETSTNEFVIAGNSQSFGLTIAAGFWEYYLIRTDREGDSKCNMGAANTVETDTSNTPITIGGIENDVAGITSSTSTVEAAVTAVGDFLCFTSTGVRYVSNDAFELGVYPNPNNGQFSLVMNLESANSSQYVRIFNVSGVLMRSEQIPGSGKIKVSIDLGDVPAGMYYIQVLGDDVVATRKIIVY